MADIPVNEAEEMKTAIQNGSYSTTGDGPEDVRPVKVPEDTKEN